jgi:hypothetical protein
MRPRELVLLIVCSMLVGSAGLFVLYTVLDKSEKVETTAEANKADIAKIQPVIKQTRTVVKQIRTVIIRTRLAKAKGGKLKAIKGDVGGRGPRGRPGRSIRGPQGPPGKDAPPITVEELAAALRVVCEGSCKGADGKDGQNGKDAPAPSLETVTAALAVVCAMDACQGPMGPAGPQGEPGPIVPCASLDPALGYACVPPLP